MINELSDIVESLEKLVNKLSKSGRDLESSELYKAIEKIRYVMEELSDDEDDEDE